MQGPLTAHGSTYAYFGNPQRFENPDSRMDLNDVLGPREVIIPHESNCGSDDNSGGGNSNCRTCR